MPTDAEPTLESHLAKRTFTPLQANQTSYWQNYRKFYVSFLKSLYGDQATPENEFGYDWLPKLDVGYDALKMFDVMHQGKTTGLICQGFNPLMAIAYKGKTVAALSKLKFLVSIDPIETDTVALLGEPRRVQRRRHRRDPDRGLHAAGAPPSSRRTAR